MILLSFPQEFMLKLEELELVLAQKQAEVNLYILELTHIDK